MINVLITGVGGQGTVLCSKLIAEAAIRAGFEVRTTETIGMAQRGGSVVSHVRIGERIYSPLIAKGQADLIIGFEPSEAVRLLPYLKKEGTVVVCQEPVKPIINPEAYQAKEMLDFLKKEVGYLKILEGDKLCKECGSPKVLNVILLGAAIRTGILKITREEIQRVIQSQIKREFIETNLKALNKGYGEA